MAEMLLTGRAQRSENPEAELQRLNAALYPEKVEPVAPEDDPFAGTEYEGMAPPWA